MIQKRHLSPTKTAPFQLTIQQHQTMASHSSLLILFGLSFCTAAVLADWPLPYDYTYVCDEQRYGKLGLKMADFSFCDKSLPYSVRAKNLVDRMNLTEKAHQLGNTMPGDSGKWHATVGGVPRLGIPTYNWWSEALHGVSDVGGGSTFTGPVKGATSFPTPITTAATFNETLWNEIGKAVSTEARAMHNLKVAGLTFWSPNINLARDPRWGRTHETPGEDPYVAGRYAVNYVRGLQDVEGNETASDPNTRPLKVSACCKHYAAYDVDLWKTTGSASVDRFHYNANVTERDMIESYVKPFEMCVKDGDVSSVMCSYNEINGVPACADARLLKGTIRGEWGLHGYIVSDCDAVAVMVESQQFLDDMYIDGAAQAMRAGLDLDCGWYYPWFVEGAVRKGLIKESDVDQALINNYMVLLRLGYFDGSPVYESLDASHVCSPKHIELAADAAREGMVLLKNDANTLPLDPKKFKKIAVVGPHANVTTDMIGNYAGVPCHYTSPIDGFKKYAEVDYQKGCEDVHCHTDYLIFNAMTAAMNADATVVVLGLNLTYEREDFDRSNFDLPGYQNHLIERVSAVSKGPVIVVVLSAGTVNISSFVSGPSPVPAIIWAGYPGQEGGQGIADVVYGAYNPSGRLPATWYRPEYLLQLPMTSHQFRPNDELGYPGRTYRFYNGSTLFDFGHGLSYTSFKYSFTGTKNSVSKKIGSNKQCYNNLPYGGNSKNIPACRSAFVSDLDRNKAGDVNVSVLVTNSGTVDGSDVVALYAQHPQGLIGAPIRRLVAFQKVFLKAGQKMAVSFLLDACESLAFVTDSAYVVLPQGQHQFNVGDQWLPYSVQLQ